MSVIEVQEDQSIFERAYQQAGGVSQGNHMLNQELNQYLLEWAKAGGEIVDDNFARYLRVLRRKHNYSREEFAELSKIHVARLIAIENGLVLPSEYEKSTIEKYVKLSYSEFCERLQNIHLPDEKIVHTTKNRHRHPSCNESLNFQRSLSIERR